MRALRRRRGQVMSMDQHAVLRAPRVLGDEVRRPRREAPALREAVVDAAGHRHVEDLDSESRRVALRDPERRLVDADLLRVPEVVDAAPIPQWTRVTTSKVAWSQGAPTQHDVSPPTTSSSDNNSMTSSGRPGFASTSLASVHTTTSSLLVNKYSRNIRIFLDRLYLRISTVAPLSVVRILTLNLDLAASALSSASCGEQPGGVQTTSQTALFSFATVFTLSQVLSIANNDAFTATGIDIEVFCGGHSAPHVPGGAGALPPAVPRRVDAVERTRRQDRRDAGTADFAPTPFRRANSSRCRRIVYSSPARYRRVARLTPYARRWTRTSTSCSTRSSSSSRTPRRGLRSRTRSRASYRWPTASGRRLSQSWPRRRAASAASEASSIDRRLLRILIYPR